MNGIQAFYDLGPLTINVMESMLSKTDSLWRFVAMIITGYFLGPYFGLLAPAAITNFQLVIAAFTVLFTPQIVRATYSGVNKISYSITKAYNNGELSPIINKIVMSGIAGGSALFCLMKYNDGKIDPKAAMGATASVLEPTIFTTTEGVSNNWLEDSMLKITYCLNLVGVTLDEKSKTTIYDFINTYVNQTITNSQDMFKTVVLDSRDSILRFRDAVIHNESSEWTFNATAKYLTDYISSISFVDYLAEAKTRTVNHIDEYLKMTGNERLTPERSVSSDRDVEENIIDENIWFLADDVKAEEILAKKMQKIYDEKQQRGEDPGDTISPIEKLLRKREKENEADPMAYERYRHKIDAAAFLAKQQKGNEKKTVNIPITEEENKLLREKIGLLLKGNGYQNRRNDEAKKEREENLGGASDEFAEEKIDMKKRANERYKNRQNNEEKKERGESDEFVDPFAEEKIDMKKRANERYKNRQNKEADKELIEDFVKDLDIVSDVFYDTFTSYIPDFASYIPNMNTDETWDATSPFATVIAAAYTWICDIKVQAHAMFIRLGFLNEVNGRPNMALKFIIPVLSLVTSGILVSWLCYKLYTKIKTYTMKSSVKVVIDEKLLSEYANVTLASVRTTRSIFEILKVKLNDVSDIMTIIMDFVSRLKINTKTMINADYTKTMVSKMETFSKTINNVNNGDKILLTEFFTLLLDMKNLIQAQSKLIKVNSNDQEILFVDDIERLVVADLTLQSELVTKKINGVRIVKKSPAIDRALFKLIKASEATNMRVGANNIREDLAILG